MRPGISLIAEYKRRSPSAGEIREGVSVRRRRPAPTSAAAPRRSRSSPSASTSAARSTTCAPRAPRRACRSCARTSSSTPTRSTSRRPRAPTPSCSSSPCSSPSRWPSSSREATSIDLDVLVEVHDEEELEIALEVVDADLIGINNRDLNDFTIDVERTFDLLSDVPAGKTVVSESGFTTRDAARRARARRRRRRARRRVAHARAATWRRRRAPCSEARARTPSSKGDALSLRFRPCSASPRTLPHAHELDLARIPALCRPRRWRRGGRGPRLRRRQRLRQGDHRARAGAHLGAARERQPRPERRRHLQARRARRRLHPRQHRAPHAVGRSASRRSRRARRPGRASSSTPTATSSPTTT